MPVRFGLIGLGAWGARYVSTLSKVPGAGLAAVASRNPDASSLVGDNVSIWQDWQHMLLEAELDAIVVATPPQPRQEIALAAIAAMTPILLEKPIALNFADARRILHESRQRNVIVSAGHLHLYAPAFRAIRTAIHDAGDLIEIIGAGGNLGPFRGSYRALLDYGPHDVSMAINLVGAPPLQVKAKLLKQGADPADELVQMTLFFENCQADLTVGNQMSEKKREISVTTPDGLFTYDDLADPKATVVHANGTRDGLPTTDGMALTEQLSRFTELVASGASEDPDFEQAVQTTAVLDAVMRSLETGDAVPVISIVS